MPKTTKSNAALTPNEHKALGRLLVGRLLDSKLSALPAHWKIAAKATRAAARADVHFAAAVKRAPGGPAGRAR